MVSQPSDLPASQPIVDKKREARRQQILSAAKAVFADRGYHNASINAIIRRAGIARGTFYLYFESKQKVFDSVLVDALEELQRRITRIEVDAPAAPPGVQLRDNLVRIFDFLLTDKHFTQLLLAQGVAAEAEDAERIGSFFDQVIALINHSLTRGITLGLVRPCNTEIVAAALVGTVRGVVAQMLDRNTPLDRDEVIDELIAFAVRGVVKV